MPDPGTTGGRFWINMVGALAIVLGVLPLVRLVLGYDPGGIYDVLFGWLGLEGNARAVPPAALLLLGIALTWHLERRRSG